MKMRRQHCVPLSRQALEMLEVLHGLTGHGQFLFQSFRTSRRCMSENTVSASLRRLGYSREEMTEHGFRSTQATLLNQTGPVPHDRSARQAAHRTPTASRLTYTPGTYKKSR